MGRPKKEKPNHGKYFEIKKTIGHKLNGDPVRKSFYSETSRADADQQGEEWIVAHKVAEQTGEAFIEKEYTFAQWTKKWLEVYKRPNVDFNTYHVTYEQTVNNHLIPYFGKAKMNDIKPIDIHEFFDSKLNLSDAVLKRLHMCLNGIFESGIDNDVCRKNPVKHVSVKSKYVKRKKRVYSEAQINWVKECSKDKMLEIYVLLCSGVRRGELLGLKWSDFSKERKTISVNRALADVQDKIHRNDEDNVARGIKENPPKWKSYRTIPIDNECAALIGSLPHSGDYIFAGDNGGPQSPCTWSEKFKRFMAKLHNENPKIPALTPHELRHTFGTHLHRTGVDIFTIQKIMGHKDIKMTTEIYVHDEVDTLRKDMNLDGKAVQVSYKCRTKENTI